MSRLAYAQQKSSEKYYKDLFIFTQAKSYPNQQHSKCKLQILHLFQKLSFFYLRMCYIFFYNHFDIRGRKPLQERIEPPILISRLMTFVMATSLVVLCTLVFTFDKMFPLNRPQIFFVETQKLGDKELILTELPEDFNKYKEQFIREYIKERNEIVPDLAIMRAKWANNDDGIVKTRSTDSVFGEFVKLGIVKLVDVADEALNVTCTVEFPVTYNVVQNTKDNSLYHVTFFYRCITESMQKIQKYNMIVRLESGARNAVRWAERMQNPLGLKVQAYVVKAENDGDAVSDPLNWPFMLRTIEATTHVDEYDVENER